MSNHLHTRIFRTLLLLYPSSFRAEFGDEMLEVSSQVFSEAAKSGDRTLWRVCLREFWELPRQAPRERWKEIRNQSPSASLPGYLWEDSLSTKERFLAMAAFLAPAVALLASAIPPSILAMAIPLVMVFLCTLFFTGLIKGFPRWSLPYLGLALSAISFLFLFNKVADYIAPYVFHSLGFNTWNVSVRLLMQAFWAGLMWLSLFVLVFLAIVILSVWQRFRQLYWRVRRDWTQVSFILYSGAMLVLVLMFENYRYEEPYIVASMLCLAAGAWFYMRSPHNWQRILVLIAGVTLAMCISAAGKWLILPRQDWNIYFYGYPPESERWFEAERTLLELGVLLVVLVAPGILSIFPPRGEPAPA